MFVSPRKKRKDRYGQNNNTRKGSEDSSFPILARGNCRFPLRTHRLILTAKMLTGQPTGNAGWFTQDNPILAASIRTPLVLARLEKHLVVSLDKGHYHLRTRGRGERWPGLYQGSFLITKLRGWYKSLYRSHRGPLCKKDDVQKTFHQGSLLLRFPD